MARVTIGMPQKTASGDGGELSNFFERDLSGAWGTDRVWWIWGLAPYPKHSVCLLGWGLRPIPAIGGSPDG